MLLSAAAAALVETQLPDGTELQFLRSELLRGTEKVEAIHELVDHQRPRLARRRADDTPQAAPSLPLPLASSLPSVFVGRRDVTETIHAARDRAARGSVETVLLGGEPGAGKTSIASAIARVAHGHDWTVLFGSCDELVTTPYEPFRAAIGEYVSCAPMSVLADHVAKHGGEIGRLTPNLSARVGGLPLTEAEDPETSRRLLFEAVADLVRRAAADRPVLFVLDDIQWADRNTLLLIHRLASGRDAARLVLLGTYRSTEADVPDFASVLTQLRGLPSVADLQVAGLDHTALVDLLEAGAGHSLAQEGQDVASYLLDETDGNAVVRGRARASPRRDRSARPRCRGPVARPGRPRATSRCRGSVRAVLRTRVGRLDPEAQRALAVASVVGREFDPGRDRGRARARRARRARPDRSRGAGVVGT